MKKRILSAAAAFAVMTSMLTPVYANEVDLDITELLDDTATLGLSLDEDDVEKEGGWYSFNNGTLLLQGTLEFTGENSLGSAIGVPDEDIIKIKINPGAKLPDPTVHPYYYGLFTYLSNLKEIEGLYNLDTSSVTNMSFMFQGCESLETVDLSGFDTSKVTNMSAMFNDCTKLKRIDLSYLDTSKVTNMKSMFNGCESLTWLDLSKINTSRVTDMSYMFTGCSSLKNIDMSRFNTSNVTSMYAMFSRNASDVLDLSAFDTSKVTDMSLMFKSCPSLTTIIVSDKWTVSSVKNSYQMFLDDTALVGASGTRYDPDHTQAEYARIDNDIYNPGYMTLSSPAWCEWDRSTGTLTLKGTLPHTGELTLAEQAGITNDAVKMIVITSGTKASFPVPESGTRANGLFEGYKNMKEIRGLYNLDVSALKSFSHMFDMCESLQSVDLTGVDSSNITDMSYMFYLCFGMTSINNLSALDTSKVTTTAYMFDGCSSMYSIDLKNFNTSNVTDMRGMFFNCTSLRSIDLSGFNTSKVTNAAKMFTGCWALTALDLSSFNTTKVQDMSGMFRYCIKLNTIVVSDTWDNSVVRDSGFMFDNCPILTGGAGTKYNENYTDAEYARIDNGASDPGYFTSSIPVSPAITKIEPGNGKMTVYWTPVYKASTYTIYFTKAGGTEKSVERQGTQTSAYIGGLENGTYTVYVKAVADGKRTTQKNRSTAVLKNYSIKCTTQATASGEITISWDKFSGASRYRVVCIDKNNNVRDTKTTSKLSFKWQGLHNGEDYGFYVQPYVNGVYPTFVRTDAKDKQYISWTCPVNSPMITKLSLGNQKIWIYYESVPRATKYYIYKSADGKETLLGNTTATKYLATGLTNGKATTFYVKALVDGKLTPLKRPATRTTRAGMKPALTVTSGQCALKWSKYTDSKASATKYKVVFVDANYKTIDYRETANLSFTWKDKRLVKGRKYGFYVVPYVNGEYIPFGLSYAEDKANVVMFTAK